MDRTDEARVIDDLLAIADLVPQVPAWAHALVYTYFENNPPEHLNGVYRKVGYDCYGAWASELGRLFTSVLALNDAFLEVPFLVYYTQKYGMHTFVSIAKDMDMHDQQDIFRAYCSQLGIHWTLFPLTLDQVLGLARVREAGIANRVPAI